MHRIQRYKQDGFARTTRIMRRKSAYILFLAVLGLLVIGIVMLFSTSAYARDSHGDVYFFIKRQAIWIGIGLVACIFAALVNYQFWQKTWWLWFAWRWPLWRFATSRTSECASTGRAVGRLRPDYLSAIGARKNRDDLFPRRLVCAT
jgi:Bacterial cell division membrane protein